MTNENVELIRQAYDAYARGDLPAMLEFIDPALEWTYLDPAGHARYAGRRRGGARAGSGPLRVLPAVVQAMNCARLMRHGGPHIGLP